MKILILGDEKGLFSNLAKWINLTNVHTAKMWNKHGVAGDGVEKTPMPDPDIILNISNFCSREELQSMGVTTYATVQRVCYNLGNSAISPLLKDWRFAVFNDFFVSYNPGHKAWEIPEVPNKFANMKCLPLPMNINKYTSTDFSASTLKVCQSLSKLAYEYGAYSKQTQMIARACKVNAVPFDLIFGLEGTAYSQRLAQSPVLFDNGKGIMGAATWEALSSGQCVITYLDPGNREALESFFGSPLPILSYADGDRLASLTQLIADMKSGAVDWKAKCVESRQFMQQYFSPTKITTMYLNYFTNILN